MLKIELWYQCFPIPFLPYNIKLQNNRRILFAPLSRSMCYDSVNISNWKSARGFIQFKAAKIPSPAPEGESFPRELVAGYLFLPAQHVEVGCGSGYKTRLPFSPPLTVSYQRICLPCICGVEILEQAKKPGAACRDSLLLFFWSHVHWTRNMKWSSFVCSILSNNIFLFCNMRRSINNSMLICFLK